MSSLPRSTQPRNMAIGPVRKAAVILKRQAAESKDAELRLKRKIDQVNRVLDGLEARAERQQKQIAALQKRKANTLARAERIEERTLKLMEAAGRPKVEGMHITLTMRPATPGVKISNESLIPAQYLKTVDTTTPIKALIKAALEAGEDVKGASLVQTFSLIRK